MTGCVLKITGFVLNMTGFVLNMTCFVLNVTALVPGGNSKYFWYLLVLAGTFWYYFVLSGSVWYFLFLKHKIPKSANLFVPKIGKLEHAK